MLKARPTPTACRAPRLLAQHVGRCIGTPSNDERCERDSDAVTAGVYSAATSNEVRGAALRLRALLFLAVASGTLLKVQWRPLGAMSRKPATLT